MKIFICLLSVIAIACGSSKKSYQTYSYDKLAQSHKKIAVIPVSVEGRKIDDDLSKEEIAKLMNTEQEFIQNMIYQSISKNAGSEEKDIKIELLSFNEINKLLKTANINILDIKNISNSKLDSVLNVDAVVRTTVNSPTMLHSMDMDLAKEAVGIAIVVFNDPILKMASRATLNSFFISAEIVDLKNDVAIWSYSRKHEIRINQNNTDVLARSISKMINKFPYR